MTVSNTNADVSVVHCWTYRRYVADKAKITPQDELKFAMKKIEQNFSNYSAWHQRSYLMPQCYAQDLAAFKSAVLGGTTSDSAAI